jgi:hypothetical protein
MEPIRDPDPAPPESLRRLVFYSLLTGLCPLIPIPFLDDWVRDLLRRRLVLELVRGRGLDLGGPSVKVLACGESPLTARGCLGGCFALAVVKPLFKAAVKLAAKLFRKVLVVLAVREGVLAFSITFHEAYLVRHALALGALAGPRPPVLAVRRAIEAARAGSGHRPIERLARRTMRGSWRLLRRGGRELTRLARRLRRSARDEEEIVRGALDLEAEERVLGGLVDELTEEIEQEDGYLRQLEQSFEKHLADRLAAASRVDSI